jgi:UDP-glucose 4-epimerase
MKVAITGASGNVGTALLRRLCADGDADLVGISRRPPPTVEPYASVEWHAVDVSKPGCERQLREIFRGVDAVVHAAWAIQPSHQRELLRATNQGGSAAVAAAARAAGVPHLVHLSSVGTYAAASGQWKTEGWSTAGISTSSYSVDKAACEAMLDEITDMVVTRVRSALILQPAAASEISRYFIGNLIPVALLRHEVVRFAPLPRQVAVQFVHTDDVADALVRILRTRAGGAFNLAAEPVLDREQFATIFGGVGLPVSPRVLRTAADLSWRARLQPTDGGWIDLGLSVPLMTTEHARDSLGWTPTHTLPEILRSFTDALRNGAGGTGPLLYPRRRRAVHPPV